MERRFYRECGCDGDPACHRCRGTNRIRDSEAEMAYADYCHDRDKDDRLTKHGRFAED